MTYAMLFKKRKNSLTGDGLLGDPAEKRRQCRNLRRIRTIYPFSPETSFCFSFVPRGLPGTPPPIRLF